MPGPGQYDVKTAFGSSTGFSLYGKIDPDFTKNEKKPGPEAYDPKPVKSSSTIRFNIKRPESIFYCDLIYF